MVYLFRTLIRDRMCSGNSKVDTVTILEMRVLIWVLYLLTIIAIKEIVVLSTTAAGHKGLPYIERLEFDILERHF